MHADAAAHPHLFDVAFFVTTLRPRYWRRRP